MINYMWGIIVALLLLVAAGLALDNGRLEKQLSTCQWGLNQADVSKRLYAASLLEQNTRIEQASKDTESMKEAGRLAAAESVTKISALEQRIADLRREPKAADCEGVRQKLVRGALL